MKDELEKKSSRKKFLLWGTAIASSATVFSFLKGSPKGGSSSDSKESNKVKMLTQDGKLVEVDVENIACGKRKKITDEQLKSWVKK